MYLVFHVSWTSGVCRRSWGPNLDPALFHMSLRAWPSPEIPSPSLTVPFPSSSPHHQPHHYPSHHHAALPPPRIPPPPRNLARPPLRASRPMPPPPPPHSLANTPGPPTAPPRPPLPRPLDPRRPVRSPALLRARHRLRGARHRRPGARRPPPSRTDFEWKGEEKEGFEFAGGHGGVAGRRRGGGRAWCWLRMGGGREV